MKVITVTIDGVFWGTFEPVYYSNRRLFFDMFISKVLLVVVVEVLDFQGMMIVVDMNYDILDHHLLDYFLYLVMLDQNKHSTIHHSYLSTISFWTLTIMILMFAGGRPSLVVYKFKYNRIATFASGMPVIDGWLPYPGVGDE